MMETFIWILILVIIIWITYDRFYHVSNNDTEMTEGFTAQKLAEVNSFYDGNNLTTKKLEIGENAILKGNIVIRGDVDVKGNVNLNGKKIIGKSLSTSKEINELVDTLEKELNADYVMLGKPYYLMNNGKLLGWFPNTTKVTQIDDKWVGTDQGLPGANGYIKEYYAYGYGNNFDNNTWAGAKGFGKGQIYGSQSMNKDAGDINKLMQMTDTERKNPANLINTFTFY